MTTPSPSEFLTFMRRLAVQSSLRTRAPIQGITPRYAVARPFSAQASRCQKSQHEDHTLNTDDRLNVQHDAADKGREQRAKGEGGTAMEGDTRKSTERAKKEFPEAPDVVIGMQDERGGKGH